MNFNCIIKTGLVAVAAMVSLSSFSQDLIARQAPIEQKIKISRFFGIAEANPCRTIRISRFKSLSELE